MRKVICALLSILGMVTNALAQEVLQALDYTDGLEVFDNPHIGFYRPTVKHFSVENNNVSTTRGNLVHLRMDISAFSDQAVLSIDKETGVEQHGVSQPLSQDMLDSFEALLDEVRSRGASAIVRFAYDPYYEGKTKCDPEQSVILQHLRQLGEVYARNTDVITYVELGMYGSWGEMHSSNHGSNEDIAEALQTLLSCTPPEIKVGVRRPDIVACWLKVNEGSDYSGFDIHSERFRQAAEAKGDTLFRVGMYNDGYLGSDSDLGTVGMGSAGHQLTRTMMVNWLEAYSQHTPYGGELVANYNGDRPINTPTYLSQEGYLTHTSYLNYEWHQPTILGWKDSVYHGMEEEYDGCDGYTYVANHLGYRFVLRESYLPESVSTGESAVARLLIENVGYANLSQKKSATLIFSNGEVTHELSLGGDVDARNWLSRSIAEVELAFVLPLDWEEGEYDLYLRLSDDNRRAIRLGNPSSQYWSEMGANKIGSVKIVAGSVDLYDPIVDQKTRNVRFYSLDGRRVKSIESSSRVLVGSDGQKRIYVR